MTGPRFQQLAAELRERIALGDYARSGALDSEAELARRYGVSRVTVRRALEDLRDQGLIAARKGSGWFVVSGVAFGQSLALGTFRHAKSAVTVPLTRRVNSYEYVPAPADIARLLEAAPQSELLRIGSVRHAGKSPLDAVVEWIPLEFGAPVSRAEAEDPGVWETLRRNGHTIDLVRQSITATAASDSTAALLQTQPGTPLLLVRRLAIARNRPLALSEHRYLGHRFRLDVEFHGWPSPDPPGISETD
jgi:GntR family transcriptional regulator